MRRPVPPPSAGAPPVQPSSVPPGVGSPESLQSATNTGDSSTQRTTYGRAQRSEESDSPRPTLADRMARLVAARPVSERKAGAARDHKETAQRTSARVYAKDRATGVSPLDAQTTARKAPAASADGEQQARRELKKAQRARRRYERKEAKRFTERARRHRRMVLGWLAAFGAMVLGVVIVAYSPALSVRTIDVSGTSSVDAQAVADALKSQTGRPLALVDYGAIDQAMEAFPLVASYWVEAIPPETLRVRIVERQPAISVQTPQGFALLDAAGVTITENAERAPGFALFDVGSAPVESAQFRTAVAILQSMPPALAAQVDQIQAPTVDSVTFLMSESGRRVIWGSADESALKAQILERLLAQTAVQGSEYDVSSPESPVVR